MGPIRVLVVDDSVVIRKLLSNMLSQDSGLEVVGSACDGRVALSKIGSLKPDLVTLDVDMPIMNGLETLAAIRRIYPKLPVVMFSTLTERGASATLDALALGASDYATKPSHTRNAEEAALRIQAELIPKIKGLCGVTPLRLRPLPIPRPTPKPRGALHPRIEVLAIGTSTGGPNALAEVLPKLPDDFPVPVLVVQHMPPIFTRLLAERLDGHSSISVKEGVAGTMLSPGQAWIAPGNFHMVVTRTGKERQLGMNQAAPENFCRPAVDVLFRSVAAAYGPNVLGVVMTGMGSDGVLGAQAIREAGGDVIIQDEASSVVWGMPGLIYASGLEDGVYPLQGLAAEIIRRVRQNRTNRSETEQRSYARLESRAK